MAKDTDARQFIKMMNEEDFETAKDIFQKNIVGLKEYCGMWFVQRGRDKVANEISIVNDPSIKAWMLKIVFVYTDQEYIEDVLKKVEPSDEILSWVASCTDLASRPDEFIFLIKRITNKFLQGIAVGYGVCALFVAGKTRSFDPLLHELRSDKFSDSTLADAAISQAFFSSCVFYMHPERALFAVCYHNYYALPARHYAYGLGYTRNGVGPHSALFKFLVARARRDDMREFMNMYHASLDTMPPENREAVFSALTNASPPPRMDVRRDRANMIRGILEIGISIPLVIIKIIWDYDI